MNTVVGFYLWFLVFVYPDAANFAATVQKSGNLTDVPSPHGREVKPSKPDYTLPTRILLRKRDLGSYKWEKVSVTTESLHASSQIPSELLGNTLVPLNISAQAGTTAYLPCSIKNAENKTVSWIRSRDAHILTVDRYIFIADERFQAWHQQDADTWTLMVKFVQKRDEGRYECQVSTEPKTSSFVNFHVVSPVVAITGGTDVYVKMGSPVSLTCVISEALLLPKYIFWYKDGKRVVSHVRKGSQTSLEHMPNKTTVGTLDITSVAQADQGTYHCAPEKLTPARVMLHVINGEHPAAMQHGTSVMVSSATPELVVFFTCLILLNQNVFVNNIVAAHSNSLYSKH